MGFLESLGQMMSKLFSSQTQTATQRWEENLTLEQIEDLERQGCDMTEYRKRFEEREIERKAEYERRLAILDYAKLEPYYDTPRDPESDFVKDVIASAVLDSKEAKKAVDGKIVYAAVVQAGNALWEPGKGMGLAVFVFALDDKHIRNEEWLLNVAEKISELKESKDLPKDNAKLIKTLRDDQSRFCFKLGESLSGDADAWCATCYIPKQELLPEGRLPVTRVLPMLSLEYPGKSDHLYVLPAKYYTK